MRIVFFGTPEYVVPVVHELNKHAEIIAVVTQPPKPAGRGNRLVYSEIDHWAHKRKIQKYYSATEAPTAELGVLASYGEIIPKKVLQRYEHGILNIHPSLLPEFRGASPIQATILSGKERTGVSIMKMDEKLDHGPIVVTAKEDVDPGDDSESLRAKLFERSAKVLIEAFDAYINGKIRLKEQDHKKATYTTLVQKEDAFLDPKILNKLIQGEEVSEKMQVGFIKDYEVDINPESMERLVRAMNPWPIVWSRIQTNPGAAPQRIKIYESKVSGGKFVPLEVQLEGKNIVDWEQFKQGYPEWKLF